MVGVAGEAVKRGGHCGSKFVKGPAHKLTSEEAAKAPELSAPPRFAAKDNKTKN